MKRMKIKGVFVYGSVLKTLFLNHFLNPTVHFMEDFIFFGRYIVFVCLNINECRGSLL